MNSVEVIEKSQCFSCRSCEQICYKNAIRMVEDREGFLYPNIDKNLCIECKACINHCPVVSFQKVEKTDSVNSYISWVKNIDKRLQSTSGGIFTAIAEYFLENDGIVYGAAYDENLQVHQIGVDKKEMLIKLKGSKYVASNTEYTYREVKKYLIAGKSVLYSGTPCQIAGLISFLGKKYKNLFTVDLICHGVPSQKLFNKYLNWLEQKNKDKIRYYGFRDKDVGGWACGGKIKIITETKTKTINGKLDPYYASFLRCETYRESCYVCPFANPNNRPADITLGDFFEVSMFYPDIEKEYGVSLCILNTHAANVLFDEIKESIELFNIDRDKYLPLKRNLTSPSPRPHIRNSIYSNVDSDNLEYFHCFPETRIIFFIKYYVKRIIKKVLPSFFIKMLLDLRKNII